MNKSFCFLLEARGKNESWHKKGGGSKRERNEDAGASAPVVHCPHSRSLTPPPFPLPYSLYTHTHTRVLCVCATYFNLVHYRFSSAFFYLILIFLKIRYLEISFQ